MLDFTSSLYLGLRHDSRSLRPWTQLTTGVPAALASPPGAEQVAERMARLQGCEQATLGPSTFHIFWDLFGLLAGDGIAIYVDRGAYPIAWWGAAHAAVRGVPVRDFPHHDPSALAQMAALRPNLNPVVVADGVCACCGRVAPVKAYVEAIRPRSGLLVLDDTQALGIMGQSPSQDAPYGCGGGGSLRRTMVGGENVVMVCSLAKAFGVPLAVLSGSREMVERFKATSQTRVHCSPPSAAGINAAERALDLNDRIGDDLRRQLAQRVRLFRERLHAAGLSATGGLFPIQRLPSIPVAAARDLHASLLASGVRTVLQKGHKPGTARIGFVITAQHRANAIERAVSALAGIAPAQSWVQPTHG